MWDKSVGEADKAGYLVELSSYIKDYEPSVDLTTFAIHEAMLPYSPTTLKKDKNKMSIQQDGYVQVTSAGLKCVRFSDAREGVYKIEDV